MTKSVQVILLLCILSTVFAQNCGAPNPSQDLIDSGKLTLQRRGGNRQHCFSAPVNYQVPITGRTPQIAISISKISGYNPVGGFDYSVSAGRQGTSNNIAINVQINEDARWVNLQISYMISSNQNIILGSFIGNLFSLTSCSGSNNQGLTSIQTYIPQWRLNNQTNYRAAVFVSGFRTLDNGFRLQILQSVIDKADGRLSVQILSSANPGIQYVYISYVVYPTTASSLLQFSTSLPQSTYRLQGLSSVQQTGSLQYNQFSICRRGPTTTCGSNQVPVGDRCQCARGFIKIGTLCRQICAFNGFIDDNRQCVCQAGFQFNQQGVCIPIPQCSDNQVLTSGTCQCKPEFYRSNRSTCLPFCPGEGQVWNGFNCACTNGYIRIANGQCIKQINCQTNEILQGNQCVCAPGFFKDRSNRCVPTIECRRDQININGVCQCAQGFVRNRGGNCVPAQQFCKENQVFNSQTGVCQCQENFIRSGAFCIPNNIRCGPNFQFVNGRCVCIRGWATIGGNCRRCPPGSDSNTDGTTCICPPNSVLTVNQDFVCTPCPPNSMIQNNVCNCNPGFSWTPDRTACIRIPQPQTCPQNSFLSPNGRCTCLSGFTWNNQGTLCVPNAVNCQQNSVPDGRGGCVCNPGFVISPDRLTCIPVITCPNNGYIGPQGTCLCNNGFYFQNNTCQTVPSCPPNSIWNQNDLKCVCTIAGQFLIGGRCQPCPVNENWNSTQCVCNQGFYRIAGVCRTCDQFSAYNGSDCVCNVGYYGDRDSCQKCHQTCGRCTGPESNKCVTCADISFTLNNGYCTKDNPCPVGYYLQGNSCARCSDYCQICANQMQCGQCADGFQISLIIGEDQTATSYCEAVCGDGRKVDIQQCDDGNKVNGDGCRSNCTVQNGWICQGGTSIKRSICSKDAPTRSILQVKGAVNLLGKVVQGVRLSFIPKCFTDKQCMDCFKIIDARVIQGSVPTLIKVTYVPNSQGQFIIEYDFGSLITSTYFKYLIQINKNLPGNYPSCFLPQDFAQQIVNTIDTATLALNDNSGQLTLEDLKGTGTSGASQEASTLPKITSNISKNFGANAPYPKAVLDKLDALFSK